MAFSSTWNGTTSCTSTSSTRGPGSGRDLVLRGDSRGHNGRGEISMTAKKISFLYIARGSSGEVRSMLHLLRRLSGMENLYIDIDELLRRVETISKQLGGWIESIKDSGFKGTRSQNAQKRE